MLRLLFICLGIFLIHSVQAESVPESLLAKLSEAEDYLQVKPSISSSILKKHLDQIAVLTTNEQLHWHQNLLRASITLNDLEQVELGVKAMLAYPELEQATDKFVSLLSVLGIYMRRLDHQSESVWLFDCGLKQAITDPKQKVSLMISKGISLRQLGEIEQARDIFNHALVIAQENNADALESSIYNTLGIMALNNDDYVTAKKYLIQGMQLSQKISRRSGHIIGGLNILMLSILAQDVILYERLHYPISRLALANQNTDRHTYLLWIEKAHEVLNGKVLSEKEQAELLDKLSQLKDNSIYNLLVQKLAKSLGISSKPRIIIHKYYQGDLFKNLRQCQKTNTAY